MDSLADFRPWPEVYSYAQKNNVNTKKTNLTPAQQRAHDRVLEALTVGHVVVLESAPGMGKSAILDSVHESQGGALVGLRDFVGTLKLLRPEALEEAFLATVEKSLARHDLVMLDDLHLITNITDNWHYPRRGLLEAALVPLVTEATARGKRLVFALDHRAPAAIARRAFKAVIEDYTPEDYSQICAAWLAPELHARLDFEAIHRFAPKLSARQLRNSCVWMGRDPELSTDSFCEYLRNEYLGSNVSLSEVAPVSWSDLKGMDDLIEALEAKIALPFENRELAAELGLKPKRGVLLCGPPGTGKTTIGRALAHRLKSKFFLIDGTVIAGTDCFEDTMERIFEAAKSNAPAVVFIDDCDVIFESGEEKGFYRYLLTMLDGLESASNERVCVMLTAMHPGSLPAALLRSGRVELWLETRLPDESARQTILLERLAELPEPLASADTCLLANASRNLTGADLRSVVEDAKLLYAYDAARAREARPVDDYFLEAIATVRANKRKYKRSKPPKVAEEVGIGFEAAG